MIHRSLKLPRSQSCLLFGPRQTGKSTLIRSWLQPEDLYVNLLPQREFLAYSRDPGRFRAEVLGHRGSRGRFTCYVDEVQRLPELLNEVHDLIETTRIRFVLTGSSARKLRRGGANLLAGRALSHQIFPLTREELGSAFDLERALVRGTLPKLWNPEEPLVERDSKEFLRTYAETYLKEEIQQEGIVRQIGPFSRFLEIAAANDGQVVNFSTVARDCGVSIKTAQQYYQILEDSFLAYRIDSYQRSARRRLIAHPKYYFFDPGVTNALSHSSLSSLSPDIRGRRFEQWVVTQIIAYIRYARLDLRAAFWRTHTGTEVDLLLCQGERPVAAIECKSNPRLVARDWSGLSSFREEHSKIPAFVLVPEGRKRELAPGIEALAWHEFIGSRLSKI